MNLDELLLLENQRMDERLRDVVAAAALAGSLAQSPAAAASRTAEPPSISMAEPVTARSRDGFHANYPQELRGTRTADADVRVQAFLNVMVPLITQENSRIMADRQRLQSILSATTPAARDREWLDSKIEQYQARDARDLLKRMDIIPASLVLAQAAIESGWGTDRLAQQHNSFFGQKAWTPRGTARGAQGERYASFESPTHSVRSYMRNLNTHRAYQQFRDTRANMRARGRAPRGFELAATLTSYSTRGTDYTRQVQALIRSRNLGRYDN